MRCLVTGAAGFVGSHLCSELLEHNGKVWGVDDLSKGRQERIAELMENPDFIFVNNSIGESAALSAIVKEVEVIYHLAAVVGVKQYVEDPARVVEANVCQTAHLLKLAWQYGKKVLFTSTSEVYGKNKELPFVENADRLYGPSDKDRWSYAIAKSAAEHLCLGYSRKGLPVVIVRYFNAYGPRADSSSYGGVVTRFISQALRDEPLTVHGDGCQTRCFTYIDDIVDGTVKAGHVPEAEGRIINLGSKRETKIKDLAEMISEIAGGKKIVYQPYREFYGPYYEDIPRRVPDLSVAEQVLDYYPQVPLETGLKKTLEWYKSEQDFI